MKKRILPVLLTAGSVLLMLSACGKSGDAADSSAENSAQEASVSAAEGPEKQPPPAAQKANTKLPKMTPELARKSRRRLLLLLRSILPFLRGT